MLLDFFVDSCLQYLSKLYIGIIEIILVITNLKYNIYNLFILFK